LRASGVIVLRATVNPDNDDDEEDDDDDDDGERIWQPTAIITFAAAATIASSSTLLSPSLFLSFSLLEAPLEASPAARKVKDLLREPVSIGEKRIQQ